MTAETPAQIIRQIDDENGRALRALGRGETAAVRSHLQNVSLMIGKARAALGDPRDFDKELGDG